MKGPIFKKEENPVMCSDENIKRPPKKSDLIIQE